MKKMFVIIAALCSSIIFCDAEPISTQSNATVELTSEQPSVVFRSMQRLRSNDGRRIILYTNRTCELFDGDRLIVECTYRVQNGEVRLLDENGRTVYAGTYRMKSDGRNLASLRLNGTTFYAY